MKKKKKTKTRSSKKTRTRASKACSKRNVPEDLWPEILSRLPVKSILRFRSVSKSWRATIDKPDFTRLHLKHSQQLESHLLVLQESNWTVKNSKTLRTTNRFDSIDNTNTRIVGAINGLFMLKSPTLLGGLVLWNPSIRKTLALPRSPYPPKRFMLSEFGLGFDPITEDYKYLRFFVWRHPGGGLVSTAVFTLGTNSWKTIEFQGEGSSTWGRCFEKSQIALCFRGIMYTLARHGVGCPFKLVSFDLNSEVFAFIDLPTDVTDGTDGYGTDEDGTDEEYSHFQTLTLGDCGCSLALIKLSEIGGSIWVMESLGADKSSGWTQRYTFFTMNPVKSMNRSFYLKKNWEILFMGDDKVICFNLETYEEKVILEKKIDDIWSYTESLMLR